MPDVFNVSALRVGKPFGSGLLQNASDRLPGPADQIAFQARP
jgi:hypothetical protein